jgi:hypothetical protein
MIVGAHMYVRPTVKILHLQKGHGGAMPLLPRISWRSSTKVPRLSNLLTMRAITRYHKFV